ncbi:putative ABC transporter ATP-binding protein YbhF [Aquisphaera giovannonii]|uniref:Putative ABC transporter ATP-binding protein YbhF n=1 Tax=Aquisphaera giovannonii TaxID=406548 RepID=A0A5B9WAR8_9BACT|nr:ABC transporter ATP-binding protein [Aquisphaera giovannonii]QEH36980.1 putative ABC transporter ATP-binding protein YbhF [Aquisphaera giovannonii]
MSKAYEAADPVPRLVHGVVAGMQRPAIIHTEALSKSYGPFRALKGIDLDVAQGEVYGLLGPNGSGKTTAIRLLLGLIRPTSGRATVFGLDSWRQSLQVRRLVSFLPGELRLFGSMSGLGTLRFLSDLRGGDGLDRAVAIAEQVMKLDLRKKVRAYSTGMKQKLALALAFADPVDVLILDEPTSALDPSARGEVIRLVKEAREIGQTIIFSGHVLSEVEEVSDRVAILRRGRLMHVEDMKSRRALRMVLARFRGGIPADVPEDLGLAARERTGDVVLFEHRGEIGPLLSWLASLPVEDVAIGTEDLRSPYDRFHGPDMADGEDEG